MATTPIQVTHFSDPGCPFAYSALPALTALRWRYGDQLAWRHVMIGLTEAGTQYEERGYTPVGQIRGQRAFRRHGMPFGRRPKPRMAGTARACRLVVATRLLAPELEWAVFRALHFTQFTTPLPLDGDAALRDALARVPGLYAGPMLQRLLDDDVTAAYEADRAEARTAEGSPTEFQGKAADTDGAVRYTAPSLVLEHKGRRLEAGGFQSLGVYDVLVANLDPTLARREPAGDPSELLDAFPHGLTTREIATCMAPPHTLPDDGLAEDALTELVFERRVLGLPLGDGTLWVAADSPFARDPEDRIRLVAEPLA